MSIKRINFLLIALAIILLTLTVITACEKESPATPTPIPSPVKAGLPAPVIPAPVSPLPEIKSIKAVAVEAPDILNPRSSIWQKSPSLQLSLVTAPSAHPAINGKASTSGLTVKAIRNQEALFIYLEWNDKTQDLPKTQTDRFIDAAAIQFPWDLKTTTSVMMGNPGRVNIWLWRAENQTENLFAEGFGTLNRLPNQNISGQSIYANETWQVVLSRPLSGGPDSGLVFTGVKQTPIAFAIWDGANKERDGFKAITIEWVLLEL